MDKDEYSSYVNSRFAMKPNLHVVGSDHKRKGKFILCAKNKLRHEFHNIINKNPISFWTDNSESHNDSNSYSKNIPVGQDEDRGDMFQLRPSEETNEGYSLRRMKHPKVLLPEKNKLKIKAFSVESKLRNQHKQSKRSLSPARSKLESGNYSERGNYSALYLEDDILDSNFAFCNSFRDCTSSHGNSNNLQDTFERNTLKGNDILDNIPINAAVFGIKNPIGYIKKNNNPISTPVNTNIGFTFNNCVFNSNSTRKGVNQVFFSKMLNNDDRNNLRPFLNSQHPVPFKPESEDLFKERRYITKKIIPKTEERPNCYLSKLEKSLIENKIKYQDQEEDCSYYKKRINFSELKSPVRPNFEFTFSNLSTAGTNY